MCDPITLSVLGVTSVALGTVQAVEGITGAQAANDAVIDAYNLELEQARSKAVVEQQNQNIKTQNEQMQNQQEQRQMNREAMVQDAAAEATASSLGIAGNSAQRAAAVTDVNSLNRAGAFEARGESINTQHLMSSLGIKRDYDNYVERSAQNAEAAWRPMGGQVISSVLGGLGTAASTFGIGMGVSNALGAVASPTSATSLGSVLPNGGTPKLSLPSINGWLPKL